MPTRPKIENVYESSKKRPAYKIVISPKKITSMKNKTGDKIVEELLHHNMRLYKDGKRLPIGSLNLTIMFPFEPWLLPRRKSK